MDKNLIKALNNVRAKRGMDSVRLSDKEAGSINATRREHPRTRYRPSKKRKRSQKDIDSRKRWVEKKKLEALDLHPSDLVVPLAAQGSDMALPAVQIDIVANPPARSFKSSWIDLPSPTTPFQPAAPDQKLTREQAAAQGKAIQKSWGVWQYRPGQGQDWVVCRDPNEPAAPAVMTVRRPPLSELYSRPQPKRHTGCPDWNGIAGTHCNSPTCTGACGGC